MRASVASFTKKFISTFFAATLALGLVPAAAFADDATALDDMPAVATSEGTDAEGAPSEMQDGSDASDQDAAASDGLDQSMGGSQDGPGTDVVEPAEDAVVAGDDPQTAIPAATERISETVSLTQPVAQQESTRSYFLAQTLESTKSVPIVSANLPLDKGAGADGGIAAGFGDEITDDDPSASAEGDGGSELEEGDDSDESDLGDDTSNGAPSTMPGISSESTVVGSFAYLGMTFAMEPGGETVALVAVDYAKLPEEFLAEQILLIPDAATADGIDYCTVTRIAANAFAIPDGSSSIEAVVVPLTVASIEEDAFEGSDTLQYVVVKEGNPEYASYDGALYSADLTNLRLIPEGRVGAVRVAPSATAVDPEVFSHCPSINTVVADPESIVWQTFSDADLRNGNGDAIELIDLAEADTCSLPEAYVLDKNTLDSICDVLGTSIEGDKMMTLMGASDERSSSLAAYANYVLYATEGGSFTLTRDYSISTGADWTGSSPGQSSLGIFGTTLSDWSMSLGTSYAYVRVLRPDGTLAYFRGGQVIADPGYTWAGWKPSSDPSSYWYGENTQLSGSSGGGCAAYAFWNKKASLTVTLNKNTTDTESTNGTRAVYYWPDKGYTMSSTSTTVISPASLLVSSPPTRPGYNFTGYYSAASGGTQYVDKDGKLTGNAPVLTAGATWYAHWSKKTSLTITLNKNTTDTESTNGTRAVYYWPDKGYTTSSTSTTVIASGSVFVSSLPTRPGYNFVGYYSASTGGTRYVDEDGKLTDDAPALTGITTWYAHWAYATYTITWDMQGHGTAPTKTSYTYGDSYTLPSVSNVTGYTFGGWYTDANCTSKASNITSTTTGDKKFYAKWTADSYTITWDMQGHGTAPSKTSYTYGDSYTLPSVADVTGWTFGGWYTNSTCTTKASDITSTTTGDKTFYAKWTAISYSITWDMQGHGTAPAKSSYTYGDSYTLPSVSNVTGWTFGGWYTDANCTSKASSITSTTTGDKKFYAKWTAISYSITWNMNGHGTAPTKSSYTYGDSYTLPTVADVTGWSFGGWYANSACTTPASNITSTTTGDKTFYAKWTKNSHKVFWRYDGAEGKTDSEENASYNATFTMKEPGSKPGYSFAGWKATGADTNTYAQGVSFTMPDGDVVFTAQWTKSAYTKVNLADTRLQEAIGEVWHWPDRGYVDSESSTVVKNEGERIVAPPYVDGYEFLGWYDVVDQLENGEAHRMIDGDGNLSTESAPSATTTWYAHWKRVSCPVVLAAEYDSIPHVTEKGDEGVPHARFGEAFSSSAEGGRLKALPHRTGHTFMGYYTERNPKVSTSDAADGRFEGTCWIDAQGNLSQDVWNLYPTEERGSVTLYAAWRLDDCRVSFDAVSDVAPNTEPVVVVNEGALSERVWNYGEPKGYLPVASSSTFSRNGYDFCGWYFEENGERVFVSDAEGNPTPDKWMFERASVVLRPAWTAKRYTLLFDPAYPDLEGVPSESPEPAVVELSYDDALDLSSLAPSFGAFSFAGWYDESERSFEGAHMTDGRFTPRGSLVAQDPIRLHARWNEPGRATYTLYVGTPDGTELVSERPYEYRYTETIAFNGTEAPEAPEGHRFVGWVEVSSDAEARAMIAAGGPAADAVTTPGFGPLSSRNLFFVAKWATVPLSTTLLSAPSEDGASWLLPTDRLVDFEREGAIPWSGACEAADVSRPELARSLSYDVAMEPFALPDVVRKGHVFSGWRKAGSSDAPVRGLVVEPSRQIGSVDSRDLVYVPMFEEAYYTIVLDGNGYGEDMRFEGIAYGDSFSFPYPATLQTGSCFAAWASAPDTASSATQVFFPEDAAKLAPVYDEAGQPTSFGLAQLANEDNVITLYAVWNAPLSVEVPLFANMAVDTESGDVIAGVNALRPIDETARYRVESIRCEPVLEEGHAPFEGTGGVYLSVYAGLSLPSDDAAERNLLRASNVGGGGEVSYADARGDARTAKPLLIALGGEAASLWTRTAPEGSPSLESVTDTDVPCGFLPFDARSPLTVRYGIWAEDADLLRAHAYGSGAPWTLPDNDAANVATSDDPRDPSYGKREGWSSESVPVARLRYTVGLL